MLQKILIVFMLAFTIPNSIHSFSDRRKCNHTCTTADNKTACWPTPCPELHCSSPVLTPGDCCLHCPIPSCNHTCIVGNRTVCWPVPCPKPPCSNPVLRDGDCCEHCPDPKCPYPCTQGGHKYCYPLPCPLPPCSDMLTTRGECCPHCPNGPDCTKDGIIIPWNHTVSIKTQKCTCTMPGIPGTVECV